MVDGQVFGALLAEQLLRTGSGRARVLRTLHFRFKNLVFAGETDPLRRHRHRGRARPATVRATSSPSSRPSRCVGDKGRVAVAPAGATVVVPR